MPPAPKLGPCLTHCLDSEPPFWDNTPLRVKSATQVSEVGEHSSTQCWTFLEQFILDTPTPQMGGNLLLIPILGEGLQCLVKSLVGFCDDLRSCDSHTIIDDMSFDQALAYMHTQLTLNLLTEDAMEGVAAFLQKRSPEWRGR